MSPREEDRPRRGPTRRRRPEEEDTPAVAPIRPADTVEAVLGTLEPLHLHAPAIVRAAIAEALSADAADFDPAVPEALALMPPTLSALVAQTAASVVGALITAHPELDAEVDALLDEFAALIAEET